MKCYIQPWPSPPPGTTIGCVLGEIVKKERDNRHKLFCVILLEEIRGAGNRYRKVEESPVSIGQHAG